MAEAVFDKTTLAGLYRFLNPAGMESNVAPAPRAVDKGNIFDILMETFLSSQGAFYDWRTISSMVEGHFKGSGPKQIDKDELARSVQMIGDKKIEALKNDYWKPGKQEVIGIKSLVPALSEKVPGFSAAVFVSRNPMINPAARGTTRSRSINSSRASNPTDFFLNFIPSYFASQMVPYLQVELEMSRATSKDKNYISTPSMMRFFLGSNDLAKLSPIDQVIEKTGLDVENQTAYAGMELFLMPQTLTNMDPDGTWLKNGDMTVRLAPPKPFVPLASIEGLEVRIQNAGAGAFAHKKGNLRMKVHDKGRLSEFAEFIRGGPGFAEARVWTTYGWMAPRGNADDAYAEFINNNMIVRDCWKVVNCQYGFDAAGSANLALDMVSAAYKGLENQVVTAGLGIASELADLRGVFRTINELKTKLYSTGKFSVPILSEQVLNAASTDGFFGPDIKDVKSVARNILTAAGGKLSPEDYATLKEKLEAVTTGAQTYEKVKTTIDNSLKQHIDKFSASPDPFLPAPDDDASRGAYFPDNDIKTEINKFNASSKERNEVVKKSKAGKSTKFLDIKATVVSFGKLFLNFILPGVQSNVALEGDPVEVQVFFYALNDQCGPISNYSIAEFPIDMTRLLFAYSQALKENNVDSLTVQAFLKLVIDTQFSDPRAIGYGMNSFYKPWDPDKGEAEQKKNEDKIDDAIAEWCRKWGAWKPPIIEFYVEEGTDQPVLIQNVIEDAKSSVVSPKPPSTSGATESQPTQKKIIKRIHVYDRQCNPFKLLEQFIGVGSGQVQMGEVNKAKIESKIEKALGKLDNDKRAALKKAMQESKDPTAERDKALRAQGLTSEDIDDFKTVTTPGGEDIVLGKLTSDFKTELSRYAPTIRIGTNGTMVTAANVASKTDGLMGSINTIKASKGKKEGGPGANDNGLFDLMGLPLRTTPVQLTLNTVGCPTMQLYQNYFVDFDTGTTIDNIYSCTQIGHAISQGKFTTSLTFAYLNGYGKFSMPQSVDMIVNGVALSVLDRVDKGQAKKK